MQVVPYDPVCEAVLALFPPLGEHEQRISLALYRLLANGAPVTGRALADAAEMDVNDVERTLAGWPDLHRDRQGRIIGYAGLSLAQTRHGLRLGGRDLYAWCAWDTLFIPPLLGVGAEVQSTCASTGAPIRFVVQRKGIEAEQSPPFVSLLAPDGEKARADIVNHFCCHVQFFADARAAHAWVSRHPAVHIATLDEACELGRRRNELRYPARYS